jgi:hypothetical protein
MCKVLGAWFVTLDNVAFGIRSLCPHLQEMIGTWVWDGGPVVHVPGILRPRLQGRQRHVDTCAHSATGIVVTGHEQAVLGHERAVPGHEEAVPGHEQAVLGHEQAVITQTDTHDNLGDLWSELLKLRCSPNEDAGAQRPSRTS